MWNVLAKNNNDDGKRYNTLMYHEKNGNIPNLKNNLKNNRVLKENKYITRIENDPIVWNRKYNINWV